MARAAIDIGSNSILLTIVNDAGGILVDSAIVVGLGRGLGDRGLFLPDRMDAAERVLRDYVAVAREHGVLPWTIRAVATSAARRSMNAPTFFARLQRDLGLKVRVISGEEEARLTWSGALRDLDLPDAPLLVVDLGGGSTELVIGDLRGAASARSIEIGSVRLTEAFLSTSPIEADALARARAHVDHLLGPIVFEPAPRVVIGVAGTATTLMTMALGLDRYDPSAVHGARLTRTDLAGFIDHLLPATPEQRRTIVACSPDRADYMLAGALILDRVLAKARRPAMTVSDRGLRFGLLS